MGKISRSQGAASEKRRVCIIGGGASGLIASIEAARYGAEVTLLEKEKRVGRKLLATGNGRCNYANVYTEPRHFHGNDPAIVQDVLSRIPVSEVLDYFHQMGITPRIEEDGKVFPYSLQGSNVLDLLRYEMERLDVKVLTDSRVVLLKKESDRWQIKTQQDRMYTADKLILATGGKAGSQLGADDSGCKLAESMGHQVTPLSPALVQIRLDADWLKSLKGVKWQGKASIAENGTPLRQEKGELLFTEYGISGPPILQLSRLVNRKNAFGQCIRIHLLPEWSPEQIREELMNRFHLDPDKPADVCLLGLFHKRLIPVLLQEAGVTGCQQPAHHVPTHVIQRLIRLCEAWEIPVKGTLSWKEAQVTAGGIDTREIKSGSMESKIAAGLHITGEVLDVDGDCGGYNLYWAWATGILAGRHAAGYPEALGKEEPNDPH